MDDTPPRPDLGNRIFEEPEKAYQSGKNPHKGDRRRRPRQDDTGQTTTRGTETGSAGKTENADEEEEKEKMKRLILFLLTLVVTSTACSTYFTTDFCREIDFWNTYSSKYRYKYIEISPDWLCWKDGYTAFRFTIRF